MPMKGCESCRTPMGLSTAYARDLVLERYVSAARRRGNRGVGIVEEFEQAGDG